MDIHRSNIGIIGDHNQVGSIHFHRDSPKPPLQLPPKHDHFIGREDKIADLIASLAPGHITALWGPGGIGKSAIASEVLHKITDGGQRLPDDFPDGLIWHDFYRIPSADAALEQIALTFGEEPRPTPQDAAKRALSGKRVLLLLDGAEAADDLNRVLETAAACAVIVTTQKRESVSDRREIETLLPQDAEALLQAWAGDMAQDLEPLSQISQLVGNLPLALRLAGAYMGEEKEPAAQYLKWLENTPLEALDFGERKNQSVRVLFKKSLDQVSELAVNILSIAGVLAFAPFAREPVAAALCAKPDELRKPFRELTGYALLVRSDDRYTLSHALIGTYARENHPPPDPTVGYLATFFTAFAEEHAVAGPTGYSRLDHDKSHILQTINICINRSLFKSVRKLIWGISAYLEMRGYWAERITTLCAGIEAARGIEDHEEEGKLLMELGVAYRNVGSIRKAIEIYHNAFILLINNENRSFESDILGNLANAYLDLGQFDIATEHSKKALSIQRKIGDHIGEGISLEVLGNIFSVKGQMERAVEHYKKALAIARKNNNRRSEGNHLGNLGNAYRDLGFVDQAMHYYQQALSIAIEIGDRKGEGNRLGNIGSLYRETGNAIKAIDQHQRALNIAEEIGDRKAQCNHLGNLGLAYKEINQVNKAIECYQGALVIAKEIGDRRAESSHLANLGLAYKDSGQIKEAIELHNKALAIAREIGDRRTEGSCLGNLGNAYKSLGQLEKAIDYYQRALTIQREIKDRRSEANQLGNLGLAYHDLGQLGKAIEFTEQALFIFEEIKSPNAEKAKKDLAFFKDKLGK
jgi:tetratricopeptide (TPR) repeat protein